ncbi:hypothetical protein BH23GEM3_BH23GEM3_10350 [soil metagenome]
MNGIRRLVAEIHRRSIWQVLAIFIATGWVVLQVLDVLINHGIVPAWVFKAGLVLLLIGLPVVLATAFVQEGAGDSRKAASEPAGTDEPESATPGLSPEGRRPHLRAGPSGVFTWRNAVLGGVAAFVLLGVASAGYMGMRAFGIGAPGTLLAQGVIAAGADVLLADFESGSDPELGSVVTKALRVDLLQSRTIRLLDRADVAAALERMVADAGGRIDVTRATQLAEREGYAVVIAGDIAKAGSGYVLTATILGGEGFRPLAAFRETARTDADLVDAIERLSRAIRDKLGDSLRSLRTSPPLAQVTTSSLPALRAYTRGAELGDAGDPVDALPHYERAVQLDSTFAMGWRKVAVTLSNMRVRPVDMRRAARRAWELSDRLPELERHLATAFYHQNVSGDVDTAIRGYEEALRIDSTAAAVRNGLAVLYLFSGRFDEAAVHFAAPLRHRFIGVLWANLALTRFYQGDYVGAQATLDSARAALPDWPQALPLAAQFAASREDYAAADSLLAELEPVARTPLTRSYLRERRITSSIMRGGLRAAQRAVDAPGAELWLTDPARVATYRGAIELQRGDTARALLHVRDALQALGDSVTPDDLNRLMFVAVESGNATVGAELLRRWAAFAPREEMGLYNQLNYDLYVGRVARLRGDFGGAQAVLEDLRRRCPACGAQAAYELGRVLEAAGDAAGARVEYERALSHPDPDRYTYVLDQPWLLRRLGELYEADDPQKAIAYYARFAELWKDADTELQPQVRSVQARITRLLPDR